MMINWYTSFELHEATEAFVFYFMIYSFLGWLLENSYSLMINEGFFKPSFLKGPFKPMYGIAPVLLLIFTTKETPWIVLIILCFFIPSIVEYTTGAMLQRFFRRQYWDYSQLPMQINGHICFPFTVCWLLLSLICIKWIHPFVSAIHQMAGADWLWIYPVILLYFLAEFLLAIRRHSLESVIEKPTNIL